MVGYDPDQKVVVPHYVHGVCGAASGFVTRFLTQPLDVCKIRFQLQFEPIKTGAASSKYRGITQAFQLIVREEGFSALWKGTVPGQALSVVYGIVEFATFEFLSKSFSSWSGSSNPKDPFLYFTCGGLAGMAATIVAQPLDVVRTRFVSQGCHKVYASIYGGIRMIKLHEGVGGFYKGLVPALLQIAPISGCNFAFYAYCQKVYRRISGENAVKSSSSVPESMICGFIAGAASKSMVYPLDVLKKRLQVQGFEEARRGFGHFVAINGLMHAIRETFRLEGVGGFFKGFSPSLLKAAFSTGFSFLWYEQFLRSFTSFYG